MKISINDVEISTKEVESIKEIHDISQIFDDFSEIINLLNNQDDEMFVTDYDRLEKATDRLNLIKPLLCQTYSTIRKTIIASLKIEDQT